MNAVMELTIAMSMQLVLMLLVISVVHVITDSKEMESTAPVNIKYLIVN